MKIDTYHKDLSRFKVSRMKADTIQNSSNRFITSQKHFVIRFTYFLSRFNVNRFRDLLKRFTQSQKLCLIRFSWNLINSNRRKHSFDIWNAIFLGHK